VYVCFYAFIANHSVEYIFQYHNDGTCMCRHYGIEIYAIMCFFMLFIII